MPVEPIPCAPGEGGMPGTCACAPSIASTPLCRADGTTVLLLVRSECVDCGSPADDPAVVGWIDAATGTFTPGPAPGDAGPCSSGCVDTVCVTRCDDTDGDGAPDATYAELWCVRADGTTTLVLTYSGDPSTPYAPVAPVECEYGCPQTETLTLCDDAGPFLRRITWLNGAASYEDTALDGQTPHIVTGTVTVCSGTGDSGTPCAEQTTPAATVGLCLPDGTPLAVILTRDCVTGAVTQDGWLNLTTGTYTSGPPPVGAAACGDSRAFELAGLLCDTAADGTVLGLVLVEYEYNPDGSLASVRFVDPATGATYTLQGELRHCPAGAGEEQPEQDLTVLCDVLPDGTVTAFVRDYRRDAASGQITGHTDYTLNGVSYTPAGTVGTCREPDTADVESWPLCVVNDASGLTVARVRRETVYDASGTATATRLVDEATGAPYPLPAGAHLGECCQTTREAVCVAPLVPTSQRVVSNPGNNTSGRVDPAWTWGLTSSGGRTVYDVAAPAAWTTPLPAGGGWVSLTPTTATSPLPSGGPATYYMVTAFELPDDAVLDATTLKIDTLNADNSVWGYALNGATETPTNPQVTWFNQPPYTEAEHRIEGAARGTNLLAIRVVESNPPSPGGVLLDVTLTYRVPGTPQYWTVEHRDCGTTTYIAPDGNRYEGSLPEGYIACGGGGGGSSVPAECCPDAEPVLLCDVAVDGTSTPFLRHLAYKDGTLTDAADTALDGVTAYTPTGTVGVCTAAEDCRNTSSLLLCDLPTDGAPASTVTDTNPAPYYPYPVAAPVAGAQTLWDGGTLNLPPGTGPQPGTTGTVNTLAATIQAPRPACDTGTAHVAVSLKIQQTGPDNGCGPTGHLRLFNATTQVALTVLPMNTPNGYFDTLTVETDVPAADLAAGNIAFALALDAYDDSGGTCPGTRHTGWQLSAFTPTATYEQTGCDTQFLRNVISDCETGAITAVVDTTLDGAPYTVTGEPGECTAGGGACCPQQPCPAQSVIEVCRCDDTDADGLPDVGYVELLAVACDGSLTSLGTYTDGLTGPYTPVAPVDCNLLNTEEGAPPAFGVQARRHELATGQAWDAAAWPTLQSVTVVAHGGTSTITTADGTSTLHTGEAATWSIARDDDARLTGPLTITADTGTVTVTYTLGVKL